MPRTVPSTYFLRQNFRALLKTVLQIILLSNKDF